MFIRTTLACVLLLATVATVTPASIRAGDGRKTGSSISASLLACDEQTCNGLRTCRSGKCECRDATMTGESCDTPKFKCLNGVRDTNGKCQCDSGYKGSLCEDFDCPNNCSSTPTKSFANGCEISDAGVHSCVCKDGYTGQDCHNRVCAVGSSGKICSAHGTCNELKAKCDCLKDWTGPSCAEKVSCSPECEHGRCTNGTCVCSAGYRGATCSVSTCTGRDGKVCNGRGTCKKDPKTSLELSCECETGYTGSQCQNQACPTDKNNMVCGGESRGSCNQDTGMCDCKCGDDFKSCFDGPACATMACGYSQGDRTVCSGNGDCKVEGSGDDKSFACKCSPGFLGTNCESKSCPKYNGLTCAGRGTCSAGVCVCTGGWGGEACQTTGCGVAANGKACGGDAHGTCDEQNGECVCKEGFAGVDCMSKKCKKPCLNNGKCMANGECMCTQRFTGQQCEHFTCMPGNPGSGVRCASGGKCNNGTCVCDKGYFGENCGKKNCPSTANGKTCSGHGICRKDGEPAGTCTCEAGWTGPGCEKLACPYGCSKRGECVNGACMCIAGWMGPGCEEVACPKTNGLMCSGHGRCNNGTCDCDTYKDGDRILGGFYGEQSCHLPYCGAHANETRGCSGNGDCVGKKCVCKKGFYGDYCSKQKCPNACTSPVHGKCDLHGTCQCNIGFTGPSCAEKYCAPLNCSGHGVCDSRLKRCVCDKTDAFSYTGAGCETLSGPVDDEEATAKAKEFAKKLNMTLRKEKEASDARALAARLREETEKKTLKNGDVLNATKKQINTLKDKQHSAVDAIKDLERDLTTLNETAAAMAKRAQDEKNEKEAKMKLTEEEASKAKKKRSMEESMKVTMKKQCRAANGKDCAGKGECSDGKCVCDQGFDASNNCQYAVCPKECSGNGECLQGRCLCDEVHTGADCSLKICSEDCGANGWCNNGTCACELGFGPGFPNCNVKAYASESSALGMACPMKCSGHGSCDDGVCKCDVGYGGVGCEQKVCPSGCSGNGECVSGVCKCTKGFMGDACDLKDCSKHNDCSGPKQGKCVNGTCACIAPFAGPSCAVKENKCLNECSGHGKCFESTCFCAESWVGKDCHRQICIVEDPTCSGNGNCTGAKCSCKAGWTGTLCETKVRNCPKDCSGNGECDHTTGTCKCSSNYTGKACDNKACTMKCHNLGKCSNGTCKCAPGWTGKQCRQPTCKNDCSGNGKCVANDDDAGKHCECSKGFVGDDCSENVAGCLAKNGKECAGNGVCMLGKCDCAEGFSGALCTISLCDPMDCNGNGRCVNGSCVCKASWSGDACDEKECPVVEGLKCAGNGVCTQLGCKCKTGWCGEGCSEVEKVKKPCPGTPMCSGHGSCREEDGSAHCVCDSGFTDRDCSALDCPKGCSGHGICNNATMECACSAGFMGKACDKKACVGGCDHGRCVDGACMCNRGFGGDNCSTELCPDNCGAHGTCEGDARCVCKDGFSGKGCTVAPGCPDGCSDHGDCVSIPGSAKGSKCKCHKGFAGLACEMEICPGAASGKMCSGHGSCNNKKLLVGVESPCACKKGWSGKVCETPICPKACSGHGDCNMDKKTCTCAVGWKGKDCATQGCDKGYMTKDPSKPCQHQFCNPIDCSGHGECKPEAMKCVCESGWAGEGCGVSLCPKACNGRGTCQPVLGGKKGLCECNKGYSGAACDVSYCGENGACSNHGQCDHTNMICACSRGFNGPHCNHTYCGSDGLCSNHGICNSKNARCECHPGYDGELCSHKVTLAAAPAGPQTSDSIIPLVQSKKMSNLSSEATDAMQHAVEDTAIQLFEQYPKRAEEVSEVATRAADGNYMVAKKFGDTLMAVAADLVLQSCDYHCMLKDAKVSKINEILTLIVNADKLLSAEMDRKQVKTALLQLSLQTELKWKSVKADDQTRKLASYAYKEYELSFKAATQLIKQSVTLMNEVATYTKATPVSEGALSLMALASTDMQMNKARTMVEEALLKKNSKKAFPALTDDIAQEVAAKALISADVDDKLAISKVMSNAIAMATKIVTTSKAHSFYRGIDDGAPDVSDVDAAFKFLKQHEGDEKEALAAMKADGVVREAKESGRNMTVQEAVDAVKMSNGNFNTALRGLGLRGKDSGKTCPNNCNGHGKCDKGVCMCDKGFQGTHDCKKPVESQKECFTCCAYEGLDSCKHLFSEAHTDEYDACYKGVTDKCVNKCTSGDKMQQSSCAHTLARLKDAGAEKKLTPGITKLVSQLEASRQF